MIHGIRTFVLLVGLGLAVGCGGSDPAKATVAGNKDALVEVGQMLKWLADEHKKPPAKLAEFNRVEPLVPVASGMIRDGSVVYIWGTPYAADSQKVAAYEKKTPTDGGFVLLQDGTVKPMTAAEFGAAPKAGKKS
jgi:hypothetical protein